MMVTTDWWKSAAVWGQQRWQHIRPFRPLGVPRLSPWWNTNSSRWSDRRLSTLNKSNLTCSSNCHITCTQLYQLPPFIDLLYQVDKNKVILLRWEYESHLLIALSPDIVMKCLIAFVFQFYVASSFLWCFIRSLPLYVDLSRMEDHKAMLSGSFLFHLSVGILLNLFKLFCCTQLLPDLLFAQLYFLQNMFAISLFHIWIWIQRNHFKLFCNVHEASDKRDSDWPIDARDNYLWLTLNCQHGERFNLIGRAFEFVNQLFVYVK